MELTRVTLPCELVWPVTSETAMTATQLAQDPEYCACSGTVTLKANMNSTTAANSFIEVPKFSLVPFSGNRLGNVIWHYFRETAESPAPSSEMPACGKPRM
jgi:hypothetical protein